MLPSGRPWPWQHNSFAQVKGLPPAPTYDALSACRDGLLYDFTEGRLPREVNIKTARHGLLRRGVNYMLLVEPLEVGGTNRAMLAFLC